MPAPLRVGSLLIASLDLEDPNFHRTVVLVIQHSEEEGTLGLVLNRPLGERVSLYSSEELQKLTGTEAAIQDASLELGGLFFQGFILRHGLTIQGESALVVVGGYNVFLCGFDHFRG